MSLKYVTMIFLVLLSSAIGGIEVSSVVDRTAVTTFLQSELASIAKAHNSINSLLREKRIPIGDQPCSLRDIFNTDNKQHGKLMVILSDESNEIECRVALERAPIGSKCIAPCGCTGSQQWIQFAVLNRMRRSEPSQWMVCQTCQQKFDYSSFVQHGGEVGNVISAVLDNVQILRGVLGGVFALLFYSLSFGNIFIKLFVSRFFWQLYPKWSRIINLPLVLKFWGGKVLFQYVFEKYLFVEKLILKSLTEIESSIIEDRLPVTVNAETTST